MSDAPIARTLSQRRTLAPRLLIGSPEPPLQVITMTCCLPPPALRCSRMMPALRRAAQRREAPGADSPSLFLGSPNFGSKKREANLRQDTEDRHMTYSNLAGVPHSQVGQKATFGRRPGYS